ncbi:hypothetical protein KL86DPRO_10498 [uncultured delta proteobacterium]|uniref:Uncharacterized protein n=1 Tax=uncultured delta proteobacterium TaxID=34034 RepID=A0A212J1D1_9DELT|nr:hypothetical protein KL86DPRO_10498 [uncultured delta proteobacterium]
MLIIGKISDRKYICEVTHTEIEKFMNLYYNNMKKFEVGDEVDLGKGYDFSVQTQNAMKKTEDFIAGNKEIIEAILNGISVVGYASQPEEKAE